MLSYDLTNIGANYNIHPFTFYSQLTIILNVIYPTITHSISVRFVQLGLS